MSRFELYELVSHFVIDERKQSSKETLHMVNSIRDGNISDCYPENSTADLIARLDDYVNKIMALDKAE